MYSLTSLAGSPTLSNNQTVTSLDLPSIDALALASPTSHSLLKPNVAHPRYGANHTLFSFIPSIAPLNTHESYTHKTLQPYLAKGTIDDSHIDIVNSTVNCRPISPSTDHTIESPSPPLPTTLRKRKRSKTDLADQALPSPMADPLPSPNPSVGDHSVASEPSYWRHVVAEAKRRCTTHTSWRSDSFRDQLNEQPVGELLRRKFPPSPPITTKTTTTNDRQSASRPSLVLPPIASVTMYGRGQHNVPQTRLPLPNRHTCKQSSHRRSTSLSIEPFQYPSTLAYSSTDTKQTANYRSNDKAMMIKGQYTNNDSYFHRLLPSHLMPRSFKVTTSIKTTAPSLPSLASMMRQFRLRSFGVDLLIPFKASPPSCNGHSQTSFVSHNTCSNKHK